MLKHVPLLLFLAVFTGALILVSCGQPKDKKKSNLKAKSQEVAQTRFERPEAVAQDFVGSDACRRCHSEIMQEYASHPMSISMSVTRDFKVEDYPTKMPVKAGKGSTWAASSEGGTVAHSESVHSVEGVKLIEHREEIDYTCGSGTSGCSYFVFDGGRMYQSPITWYTENREWDLSPGYEVPQHFRFERMAGEGCLACHAGRMNPVENERGLYNKQKPFHEIAIGCERCHGPGKDHIEFHESSKVSKEAVDPIVNPDKLTPAQREAVCYQCHLSGAPRVPRYGRTDFDFRPGMHLSDIWITVLKSGKNEGGKAKAVSQVEQMQLSQCFLQSKGELGCISCHDPHRSPTPENRIEFYRDKCISCHQSNTEQTDCSLEPAERKKRSPHDSCYQCHMPTQDADDIAHHSMIDHRVIIPGGEYQMKVDEKDELRLWIDKDVPTHSLERARAIAMAASAFTTRNRTLAGSALTKLKAFDPPAKDDVPLKEALAQLYFVVGNTKEALRIWSDLLMQFPRDEFVLDQITMALHEADRLEEAYPLYQRLFEVNNRRPSVLLRYLKVCKKLNKIDEGIKVAQRILELEPGLKTVHQWLERAYRRTGDNKQSEYHRKIADQLLER